MKGAPGLLLVILIFFGFGCMCSNTGSQPPPAPKTPPAQSTPTQEEAKAIINIPALAGKSAKAVDAILGKPGEVTPTNDPGYTPGEFRDYTVPGVTPHLTSHGLMIRFYRDRAVHFTFELSRPADTPEEALLMAGIDVRGVNPHTTAALANLWSGTFNGVSFKSLSAQRLDATYKKYTTVQAEVSK